MAVKTSEDYSVPAEQAAELVGVDAKTVIRRAKDGTVKCRLKGPHAKPRYYFRPSDVAKLVSWYRDGREPA
jgi:predicted site-specific integrase-resolvase